MGTLLDDGWGYGRKNFTLRQDENYVTPNHESVGARTRDTGFRGAINNHVMDASAQALDILGEVEEYFKMKEEIEATVREMAAERTATSLREQLAPDQRATLLIDRDTGEMKLLHAGEGYLYDPNNKPFAFELKGDDGGICRGKEVPETRSFDVIDRDGQHRKLEFEEHWKPEFEEKNDKQKDDKDRDPEDRPHMGRYGRQQEEEA